MQIVIDISEVFYEYCKAQEDAIEIQLAVKNGTPLPEHYGRLGDLDKLYTEMNNGIKAGNYEEGYETFAHINDMDDCLECVKYADTVIDAS